MKLKVTPLSGGDPEPKKKTLLKSSPQVYKTQAEVDAANAFARDFSKRHNTLFANDAYVAKKPGDPVVQYRTLDGKPYVPQQMPASMIKNSVPDWVTELHMDDEWKMPYYKDGNDMVFVKKEFYNSPRFTKTTPTNPKQQMILLAKK